MNGKKLLAFFLAFVMMFATMSFPALADETVNGEKPDELEGDIVLFGEDTGEAEDTIEISTVEDFKAFIAGIDNGSNAYLGKKIVLKNSIDLEDEVLDQPAGIFRGEFDGNGYTVKNFSMGKPLFCGHLGKQGIVKNFTLENATLNNTEGNKARLGLLCTNLNGTFEDITIKNCKITSTVETGVVGAFAAMTQNGSVIRNCKVDGFTVEIADGATAIGGAFGLLLGNDETVVENVTTKNVEITATEDTPVDSLFGANNESVEAENCTTDKELAVARCGQFNYKTLQAAVNGAEDGDEIEIISDIVIDPNEVADKGEGWEEAHPWCIINNKRITINFNGKTVRYDQEPYMPDLDKAYKGQTNFNLFWIENGSEVTFTGDGIVDASMVGADGCQQLNSGLTRIHNNGEKSTLIIKDGTYKTNRPNNDNNDTDLIQLRRNAGVVKIYGGYFDKNGSANMLNVEGSSMADAHRITCYGGTFVAWNPANTNDGNMVAVGCEVIYNESDNTYTVEKVTDGVAMAVVDGEELCFKTLGEAVDNADDDSTIKILTDIEIEVPQAYYTEGNEKYGERYAYVTVNNKKLTFDFDNHKISLSETSKENIVADVTMFIGVYNNSDITFTGNGEIEFDCGNDNVGCYIAWLRGVEDSYNYSPSKLTVENGTYKSQNIFYISGKAGYNNGGEITINGGTFESVRNNDGYNQYINVQGNTMTDGKRVTINGGTFDVDPRYYQDNWGSVVNGAADSYMVDSSKYSVTMKTVDGKKEFSIVSNADVAATVNTVLTESMYPYIGMDMWNKVKTTGLTYSYTSLAEAVANAVDGDTVTLMGDAEGDGVVIDKSITIDLNNHTYTISGKAVGSTESETNGFQLLKDNDITIKNGTITSTEDVSCVNKKYGEHTKASILIQNYSNLTLDGVTLDGSHLLFDRGWTPYTLSNNNGTVTIENSTIEAQDGAYAFDVYDSEHYDGVYVTLSGTNTINGLVQIGLGKFGDRGSYLVDADGKKYTENGDYVQVGNGFVKNEFVAEIDGTKYRTLADAIENAVDGDTITLCKDIVASKSDFRYSTAPGTKHDYYTLATLKNKKVTLDLNGYSISIAEGENFSETTPEDYGTIVRIFRLNEGADLTITGEGAVMCNVTDVDAGYAFSLKDTTSSVNLTIESGKIEGYAEVIYCTGTGDNVVIKGGVFKSYQSSGKEYILNAGQHGNRNCFKVSGGTFEKADPRYMNDGNLVVDGYTVTRKGDEYTVVADENIAADITDANGRVYSYTSLAEAVEEAKDGETVTLLCNAEGDGIKIEQNKFETGLVINLGGFTYTVAGTAVGSNGSETNGFQLMDGNNITIKNGTITSTETVINKGSIVRPVSILIQNYSNLTLDGVTLDGSKLLKDESWTPYTLSDCNGNVTIIKSTIIAKTGGYAFDVDNKPGYSGVTVTIDVDSVLDGHVQIARNKAESTTKATLKIADNSYTENGDYKKVDDKFVKVEYIATAISDGEVCNFYTLQEAYDNADNATTITLTKDITLTKSDIEANTRWVKAYREDLETITFDLGGHTLSLAEDVKDSTCDDFRFFNIWYSDVTIKNGTIDMANDVNGIVSAIDIFNQGNNSYLHLNINAVMNSGTQLVFSNAKKVEFDGGTYTLTDNDYDNYPYVGLGFYKSILNTSAGCPFIFNGGTFVNFDPLCQCKMAHYTASGLGEGKVMTKDDGTFAVVDEKDYIATVTRTVTCWEDWGQAGVKDRTYAYKTLKEAVKEAKDGETVTLLCDATGDGIVIEKDVLKTEGLVIDLGGHKYTIGDKTVGSAGTETNGFQIKEGNKVTFKNGELYSEVARHLIQNYADLTLDNVKADGSNLNYDNTQDTYTVSHSSGTLTLKSGTTVIGGENGYAFDVCQFGSYRNATAVVEEGATVTGNVEVKNWLTDVEFTGVLKDALGNTYTEEGVYVQQSDGTFKKNEEAEELEVPECLDKLLTITRMNTRENFDGTLYYPVKFYSVLDDADLYDVAGFTIEATKKDGTVVTRTLKTNTVYNSVSGFDEKGETYKYTPDMAGGTVWFGQELLFTASDFDNATVNLKITPYVVTEEGVTLTGKTHTIENPFKK